MNSTLTWQSATRLSPQNTACELLVVRNGTEVPLMGLYAQDEQGQWFALDSNDRVDEFVSAYRVVPSASALLN